MFKVICINNKPRITPGLWTYGDCSKLKEGEVYTVVAVNQNPHESAPAYKLQEVYTKGRYGFHSERFIPCSDIDETELINEEPELAHA